MYWLTSTPSHVIITAAKVNALSFANSDRPANAEPSLEMLVAIKAISSGSSGIYCFILI